MKWDSVRNIDILGMAEHHETFSKVDNSKICKTLDLVGRRCFATSARPTGNSIHGNSGGVLLAPLKTHAILPVDFPHNTQLYHANDDIVAFIVRLRGVDVMIVQVYFETGTGLGATNLGKLKKIAKLVKESKLMFVAFGDWNLSPLKLADSSFMHMMQAQIILAENGADTCAAGKGAVLDYIVASTPLCASISEVEFFKAPWKTHEFITFKIEKAPRARWSKVLIRPKKLLDEEENESDEASCLKTESGERLLAPTDEAATPKLQHWSTSECASELKKATDLEQSALKDFAEDCIDIGAKYMKWSVSAESSLMIKHAKHDKAYTGRGAVQRFVWRAVAKASSTPGRKAPSSGLDSEADELGWTMIELYLSVLLKHRLNNRFNIQRQRAIDYLRDDALKFICKLSSQTLSKTEYVHLWQWHHRLWNLHVIPDRLLAGLVMDATKRKNQEKLTFQSSIRASISKWATKAITGSASAGHKFLKGNVAPLDYINDNTGITTEPQAIMAIKTETWSEQWRRPNEDMERVRSLMKMLRTKAIQATQERGRIQHKQMRAGIKQLRNNRSLGGDFWSPLEVKALDDSYIDELLDVINEAEEKMAAPVQTLLSLIPLLQKPQGGDRPVVLASLFYVLWAAIRNPDVSPWEADFVAFWDAAVKGSSALQAALHRRLKEELHILKGGAVASTFWDLEKFYDSISLPLLIEFAIEA